MFVVDLDDLSGGLSEGDFLVLTSHCYSHC